MRDELSHKRTLELAQAQSQFPLPIPHQYDSNAILNIMFLINYRVLSKYRELGAHCGRNPHAGGQRYAVPVKRINHYRS